MPPPLAEVLVGLRVVSIPMRVRFRSVTMREATLIRGPKGWGEFAPFPEYDDVDERGHGTGPAGGRVARRVGGGGHEHGGGNRAATIEGGGRKFGDVGL